MTSTPDPLAQLEEALRRHYETHGTPRSWVGTPEFEEEPWPTAETIEAQRIEFEARAAWLGMAPPSED